MSSGSPNSAKPRWDLAHSIPWFDGKARTACLFHPQPATDVALRESRIGEPLLWPGDPLVTDDSSAHSRPNMFPVVHLNKQDFALLQFPGATELLQVVWNPGPHPVARAYWRTPSEMETMRPIPSAEGAEPGWALHRARLLPEMVVEYPSWAALPSKVRRDFDKWLSKQSGPPDGPPAYEFEFGPSPSSKAGGYAHWLWNNDTPTCECGSVMEHLFSLATIEYPDSGGRWGWLLSNTRGEARKEATGLDIRKFGIAYFHRCPLCTERPLDVSTQSF